MSTYPGPALVLQCHCSRHLYLAPSSKSQDSQISSQMISRQHKIRSRITLMSLRTHEMTMPIPTTHRRSSETTQSRTCNIWSHKKSYSWISSNIRIHELTKCSRMAKTHLKVPQGLYLQTLRPKCTKTKGRSWIQIRMQSFMLVALKNRAWILLASQNPPMAQTPIEAPRWIQF
jgi:hypothetical protein